MDDVQFEKLINNPESTFIDYKKEHYKLINGTQEDTAQLIKDIVSFCNTIRKQTAYIIIGVDEIDDAFESDPMNTWNVD